MTKIKACLLIFFISFIIYSNSLGGEFVFDDEYFVVRNINIRSLSNVSSFFSNQSAVAFAELSKDVYRPITTLSYAIDFFFWAFNTFGYHLINVLFHSFNAILLFVLLCIIFGNLFTALLASLVFACHPIETEVVSWISGRSSVLFLFFYLASLICYVTFLKESKKIYYVVSILLFGLSLFSKEMAMTFPLLIVAYDIHFFNKSRLKDKLYRYAPYFLMALFYFLTRAFVLKRVGQCDWWGGSPYYTFLTMSRMLIDYMKLLLAPVKLCAYYMVDISRSIAETRVLASLAALVSIFAATIFSFRRSRRVSFSVWWFFITLLPVLNIIPLKALIAERFLYIPSIGFCMLLAIFIERMSLAKFNYAKIAAVALALLVLISYSIRTMARNEDWNDPITISEKIIQVSPLNPWAYASLGSAYLGKHRYEEAIKPLKKSISLSLDYISPKGALGFCYLRMDRYEDAVTLFNEVLKKEPRHLETLNSIGVSYAHLKKYDEAIKSLQTAIDVDPTFVSAYLNLGSVYEHKQELDKALAQYEKILAFTRSRQDVAVAYIRIGDVYSRKGLKDKARPYYGKAAALCDQNMDELKKVAMERLEGIR